MSLDLDSFIPDSRCGIIDLRYAFTSIPLQKTTKMNNSLGKLTSFIKGEEHKAKVSEKEGNNKKNS